MKESMELSASSVEAAIKQALDQLGVTREEVRVTVLDEGKRGVLGLGSEPARVRVELLEPATGEGDSLSEVATTGQDGYRGFGGDSGSTSRKRGRDGGPDCL